MLKLIRNCLGEKKMIDSENQFIKWQFLIELYNLQQAGGLHLANKLRSAHINCDAGKMKVSLAAQVFGYSVAVLLSSSIASICKLRRHDKIHQNFQ